MIVVWALWSILVWSFTFVWMILLVLLSVPLMLFVPFARFQRLFPVPMMMLVPYLTLSRIRVTRHLRFDAAQHYIFVVNHTSLLDAHMVILAFPQVICGMMNEAHLWVPAYGWIMRMANAIPVPRKVQGRAAKLAEMVRERAARGLSVVTFPEGHRTVDGKIREFRRGIFYMARDSGVPIVPVAIRGLYDVFPKGTWIMRPGRIDIYIGPPVETRGLTDAQVDLLTERTRAWITRWVEEGQTPADEVLAVGAA